VTLDRKKYNLAVTKKTVVLFHLWREKNTAENSFCIINSTISKTFKKMWAKKLNILLRARDKSLFYGAFLSFLAFESPYLQFHITKKSETRRTC